MSSYVLRNICLCCPKCCSVLASQGLVETACSATALAVSTNSQDFVAPDCLFLLAAYLKKTAVDPPQGRPLPDKDFVKHIARCALQNPEATHFHWFLLNLSSAPDVVIDLETAQLLMDAFCRETSQEAYLALLRIIGNLALTNGNVVISAVHPEQFGAALKKGLQDGDVRKEVEWVLGSLACAMNAVGPGALGVVESLGSVLMPCFQ